MPGAQWTAEAARRIRREILTHAGGRLPRSVAGLRCLCESLGLPAGPVRHCPAGFTARLIRDERLWDGWIMAYNPRWPARTVRCFLVHELAEFLAIRDHPSLFDGLPNRVYAYTGGSDLEDARHRIARQVEYLCFRRTL